MAGLKERQGSAEVSITDVARRARVSVGTVSRVINQHPKVDPLLRRRVQLPSRQLGFVPRIQHHCIARITWRRNPPLPAGYVSVLTPLIPQFLADSGFPLALIQIDHR